MNKSIRIVFNNFDKESGNIGRYESLRMDISKENLRKLSHREMLVLLINDYLKHNPKIVVDK